MVGNMHYTIDKLVVLKDDQRVSQNPQDYEGKKGVIADEIIAFMTAHMNGSSWKLGATTSFGPHSFMLAMNPTIESLRFWRNVKRQNWQVRVACGGQLEVLGNRGERHDPPRDKIKEVPLQTIKTNSTGRLF